MIIKFPTALYKNILPEGTESGNVTWTISNNNPPRSSLDFLQLPLLEKIRDLPNKVITRNKYRSSLGDFVFELAKSNQSTIGSNRKQYEIGQVLSFEDVEDQSVSIANVPDKIDLQQNNNILDYQNLGLNDEEIQLLLENSNDYMESLVNEINNIKELIENKKNQIIELNKKLNEINKAIGASILALGTDNEIVSKLNDNKQLTINEISNLNSDISELVIESENKYNDLLKIREVVR